MKERPILFSAPMVCALLAGTKTQTRRVVKPPPGTARDPLCLDGKFCFTIVEGPGTTRMLGMQNFCREFCPYGIAGDRLWVRETWQSIVDSEYDGKMHHWSGGFKTVYKADGQNLGLKWKPSIFMPRAASRITLEIVSVRVEMVQEISQDDARAEGCADYSGDPSEEGGPSPREGYQRLWDSINKPPHDWASNPWVWVIEFKIITP